MENKIEIARSFSYKANLGNYTTADFFTSCKKECDEKDAVKVSEQLYEFAKKETIKSLNSFLKGRSELDAIEKAYQGHIK